MRFYSNWFNIPDAEHEKPGHAGRAVVLKATGFTGYGVPVLFLLLVGLLGCIGCGDNDSTAGKTTPMEPLVHPALRETTRKTPDAVKAAVELFFAAMLDGDQERIRMLLTPAARTACREKGLPFAPSASRRTMFKVTRQVDQEGTGAYVTTHWSETGADGRMVATGEIIWVVRLTEEGWRIAGAAAALYEGQEPTILNFEDPDAMLRAIAEAERKEQRRRFPSQTAHAPAVPVR